MKRSFLSQLRGDWFLVVMIFWIILTIEIVVTIATHNLGPCFRDGQPVENPTDLGQCDFAISKPIFATMLLIAFLSGLAIPVLSREELPSTDSGPST